MKKPWKPIRNGEKPTQSHEKPWKPTHEKPTWIHEKTNLGPQKNIKTHLEPWKTMKTHLERWKTNPQTWKTMKTDPWKTNLEPWKNMKTDLKPWKTSCWVCIDGYIRMHLSTRKKYRLTWSTIYMYQHIWNASVIRIWNRAKGGYFNKFVMFLSPTTLITKNESLT